uniref:Uncharacterized protein n=1 Tax=Oryza rufipogon TaxID=4529 RepID=A0A0E0RD23_ORYRU
MSMDKTHLMCFYPSKITMGGVWTGDNPLDFSIPLLLFQILLITSTTRAATLLLSPLRLPTYISQILAGFLLGPSVLGHLPHFSNLVFPVRSLFVLESMALLGLVYYTFIVGVEIEVSAITRAGIRSFGFAIGCTLPPFLVGALTGYVALSTDDKHKGDTFLNKLSFPIFLGSTFSSTAFAVLARNIAELKLAGTDVGQLTLSASLINDTFAWTGLTVATVLGHSRCTITQTTWTLTSGVVIFGASYLLLRPMLLRLARRAAEGEAVGEDRECWILIGVMVAALVADAGGTHAIFGAFVFGLAVPNGPVGVALVEKVEDFVVGALLPLFFALSGLRTDTAKITNMHSAVLLMVAAMVAAVLKVVAAIGVAGVFGMPLGDGTSIGLLLNTKGIIELVILNIARNKGIMSDQSFTVLVFVSALITAMVSPFLGMVVKPARRLVFYKRRTVAWAHPESELRVLACVHVPRDVPALLTLLDVVTPSSRSPVGVLALHLIEFVGRSSALLLINASAPSSSSYDASVHGRSHTEMHDDREVAALATRMVRNPTIDLTLLRFVQKGGSFTASEFDALKERKADEGCLRDFLERANEGGGATVEYRERGVFNASEMMVGEIQSVEAMGNKDLFVVGKVPGGSGLTAGMAEWSESPELGPIGDLLASKDFQTTASVLVLQAYGRPAAVRA